MTTFDAFVDDYYGRFITALQSFDRKPLQDVLAVIDGVIAADGVVWVAGNGGSAAISNHAVCDLTKWTHLEGVPTLRCLSLSCNVPMLTALGNDVGYDEVFSLQLKYYAKPGDAVLLISSSGNSPNVVKACEYANAHRIPSLAFVGFKGGKLRELATHSVWIPVENYGIVEDAHQSLMHVLTQYIRVRGEARLSGEAP
jgi:D-sedoheptulose 7-phosphate isomerase